MTKPWNKIVKENLHSTEIKELEKWASKKLKKIQNTHVYVIANVGVEHFNIEYICKSESRARELFNEVRLRIYKDATSLKNKDYYIEYQKALNDTTFDNQLDHLFEHPICIKYILED